MNSSIIANVTTVANITTSYCNLTNFSRNYQKVHGYLSLFVCIFGSITNVLNVFVLTRKEMSSPTNSILTGLAVADLLVMSEYIPFACHSFMDSTARFTVNYFTYNNALYVIFHALFTQVCHFVSICLTVILAVWRSIIITRPQSNGIVCNLYKTNFVIFMTYVLCPIICIPLFAAHKIIEKFKYAKADGVLISDSLLSSYKGEKYNSTLYVVYVVGDYQEISFWIYGVVIKLFPCILLTILSGKIINTLIETKKRRQLLLNKRHSTPLNVSTMTIEKRTVNKEQQADRTTIMLLVVLFLFLLTEVPQAILGLLSVILGQQFLHQCYAPLGDIMDILALTNSAINFVLYCTMSRQFRIAFKENFTFNCIKYLRRNRNSVPANNGNRREGQFTQVTQL